MEKVERYYFTKSVSGLHTASREDVIRWNPYYYVEVNENVDFKQYISFSFDKLRHSQGTRPKSDKFLKVVPVIKEIFLSHYNLAVKYIHETEIDEGEFYMQKHSKSWFEVAYFSKSEKQTINIDFRDSIEDLWLMCSCNPGYKNRPNFRKKGIPITIELFKQFLNCTLQFLYDSDSYAVFFEDYLRKFYQLIQDDGRIEGFIISAEKSFENILKQLQARKETLEKRLIESDSDSITDRAKLRGELEGINYAIKTIKVNC